MCTSGPSANEENESNLVRDSMDDQDRGAEPMEREIVTARVTALGDVQQFLRPGRGRNVRSLGKLQERYHRLPYSSSITIVTKL